MTMTNQQSPVEGQQQPQPPVLSSIGIQFLSQGRAFLFPEMLEFDTKKQHTDASPKNSFKLSIFSESSETLSSIETIPLT